MKGSIVLLALAGSAWAGEQAGTVPVAFDPQQQQAVEPQRVLEELEEVTVHGKRLRDRIIEAEDEFYKLFNQVNKDDRYDTNCTRLNLSNNAASRIESRICLPVFVADAIADYTVFRRMCQPPLDGFDEFDCLDRNDDQRLSRQEASIRPLLDASFMTYDADYNGYLTRDEVPESALNSTPAYMPPPPDLVLAEGAERWRRHMMAVIQSDPRLGELAGRLDDLHRELGEAQRRTRELEDSLPREEVRKRTPRPPRR